MNLYKAHTIAEALAEKYLFSKHFQYAGDYDDPDELADERIKVIFEAVIAIGIGLFIEDDYFIRIYHSAPVHNTHFIAEECGIARDQVVFQPSEPFSIDAERWYGNTGRSQNSGPGDEKKRPLTIGCSVGHLHAPVFGSVGCFVKDNQGNKFLLSNRHVLFNPTTRYGDDFIVQPAKPHGGTKPDIVGLFHGSLSFKPKEVNEFDAALAGPLSCEVSQQIPVKNNGSRVLAGYSAPANEMQVFKYGCTSGLTYGVLKDIEMYAEVIYNRKKVLFRNLILVQGFNDSFTAPARFSEPGDSGSVIFSADNNDAVGLLFAGSPNGYSLASPIAEVLNGFGVTLI